MTHLDEGTIHAWLDGALGAEDAAQVESHVRQCARCAGAVAEARGLAAAASRILGALDDVPGGAIPARTAPTKKQKREWRAAPWVTGIAAVLIAAVMLRTGNEPKQDELFTAVPSVSTSPRSGMADSAPRAHGQANPAVAAPSVAAAPRPRPPRPDPGSVAGAAGAAGAATGAIARAPATDLVAESRIATDEANRRERQAIAREGEELLRRQASRAEVAVTSAPAAAPAQSPPPAAYPAPQRSALIDMRVVRPIDPLRDKAPAHTGLSGCYRVDVERRISVPAGGFATNTGVGTRGAVPTAAAAPAAAAPAERGRVFQLLIRLDSLEGRPGFIVREAASDSSLGWWNRINADSARVDLLMMGGALVAGKNRVPCPER